MLNVNLGPTSDFSTISEITAARSLYLSLKVTNAILHDKLFALCGELDPSEKYPLEVQMRKAFPVYGEAAKLQDSVLDGIDKMEKLWGPVLNEIV